MPITFIGNVTEIDLMIDGEEDGVFDEGQYVAYQSLIKKLGRGTNKFTTVYIRLL